MNDYKQYRALKQEQALLTEQLQTAQVMHQEHLAGIWQARLERISAAEKEIEQRIDAIADAELRTIMELRIIQGRRLEDIAQLMHIDRSVVGKKVKRYIGKA